MKRVLLCAILMTFSTLASAVVYKWVDAQGKTLYGDRPPDGVHAEVVELLGTHASRSTAQSPGAIEGREFRTRRRRPKRRRRSTTMSPSRGTSNAPTRRIATRS